MDILQLYKTPHKADKHTEQKLKKFRNPNTLLIKSNFLYRKHQYTHRFPTFIKLYSRGFKSIMKQEKFIKTSANITTKYHWHVQYATKFINIQYLLRIYVNNDKKKRRILFYYTVVHTPTLKMFLTLILLWWKNVCIYIGNIKILKGFLIYLYSNKK